MKRVLAAATIGMVASVAYAAEPPGSAPRLASTPVFTWTGVYVGAHAGYMWTDNGTKLAAVSGVVLEADIRNQTLPTKVTSDARGATGGVQAGYNVQFGTFLTGIEADVSWTDLKTETTYSALDYVAFPGSMTHSTFRSELDVLGTLRARAGVVVDRVLFYATGGFAVGEIDNGFAVNVPGNYSNRWKDSRTEWGWAAGAGLEFALTGNLSLKAEYLYFDLGERSIRYVDPPVFGDQWIEYKFRHDGSIVRVGANYRF
jgi:outer membrane immunogenic protein